MSKLGKRALSGMRKFANIMPKSKPNNRLLQELPQSQRLLAKGITPTCRMSHDACKEYGKSPMNPNKVAALLLIFVQTAWSIKMA